MCHGLAEVRGDAVQDDVDKVVICHLGLDIESIDIIQVFLDCICLFEITYFNKSSVRLIVVAIVFPNGILNFFPSIEPILIRFPSFQFISFCTQGNISQPLYLVGGLYDGEVNIYLKDLSFQVLHVTLEFGEWWCFPCYYFLLVVSLVLVGWRWGNIIDMS